MRRPSFWDVTELHEEEFRGTFDDKEFAKVFYKWGFGIPELSLGWYNRPLGGLCVVEVYPSPWIEHFKLETCPSDHYTETPS